MPYPESCPECGGAFRNTGTHFTARRNEVGRHVLLELGCQNTTRRFWWDFTTGSLTEDGRTIPARRAHSLAATAGSVGAGNGALRAGANGHVTLSTLDRPEIPADEADEDPAVALAAGADVDGDTASHTRPDAESLPDAGSFADAESLAEAESLPDAGSFADAESLAGAESLPDAGSFADAESVAEAESLSEVEAFAEMSSAARATIDFLVDRPAGSALFELPAHIPAASPSLKEAFVRQLQLDRLTLRQMRSWLMSDEARRAIEVAAGATEATYERLALILFGMDLSQLLGKQTAAPTASNGPSAEERLELQREKARIRARLRRAAAKAARQQA